MNRVLVVPDKWKGTASAADMAKALSEAAEARGWESLLAPLSDGGEGLLDACAARCPEVFETDVRGPLGAPTQARWRQGEGLAVVELASASGLTLVGGATANDPIQATTYGTGQLVAAAARSVGPKGTVVVGLGGSATTDGGAGLVAAVDDAGGLHGASLLGACDVTTTFVDAARLFAPQKGAKPVQVAQLTVRLERLAEDYLVRAGVDVRDVPGGGAAGGTGGGIVALGGTLTSGYELVADLVDLSGLLERADRVVTGEGGLDATSFAGKVVGGVVADARARDLPVLVVVGRSDDDGRARAEAAGADLVVLTDRFGIDESMRSPCQHAGEVTGEWLGALGLDALG